MLGGAFEAVALQNPLPSAPAALPNLGPSQGQLDLVSVLAIGLVVLGAGLLSQRVMLLGEAYANRKRGRLIAVVGITCLVVGAAATLWWSNLIDISAARTQASWVIATCTIAVIATVTTTTATQGGPADAAIRGVAAVSALLCAVGLAWVGHARTAEPVAASVVSDVAHLVCSAVWVGGVGVVAGVSVGSGGLRGPAVTRVLARFSTVAALSVAVLGVSGTVLAVRIAGSFGELFDGRRGTLLLAKLVLAWAAAMLGSLNGLVFAPRARRSGDWGSVSRIVGIEFVMLAAVLVVAGLLSNQSPASH